MASGASAVLSGLEDEAKDGLKSAEQKTRAELKRTGRKLKEAVDDATGITNLEGQLAEQQKQTQVLENEAEQAKKEIQEEEQKLRDEANRKQQELLDQQASTKAANRKRRKRFAASNKLLTNEGGSQGLLGTGGSLYG